MPDYEMLIEYAVDAFLQGKPGGDLVLVNLRACELTGYSRDELLKMNFRNLFTPESLKKSPLKIDQLKSGGVIRTQRDLLRKDGSVRSVEVLSRKMPDGTYQSCFRDITGKVPAEKALIASEQKYQDLLHTMRDGFVLTDMFGHIIDSNPVYREMLGYSSSELEQLTYRDLTPEKWHTTEHEIVTKSILAEGHSPVYDKEYIRKDGSIFPVELRTFLVKNDLGETVGMWAIVRDITLRKKYETELLESERKYRQIIESSPTAMHFYQLNENGQLIFTGANPAADKTVGFSHQRLIGMNIEEAFPGLTQTFIPAMYRKVARGELGPQAFETSYQDERFGSDYLVHVFRTEENVITVGFLDIGERKKMMEALQRSEIEYRETINSMPEWIYVVDNSNRFVMINDPLLGAMRIEGLAVNRIGSLVTIDPPFFSQLAIDRVRDVFKTGVMESFEEVIPLQDRMIYAKVSVVPIRKESRIGKVIVVVSDRSKEREMEDLRQRTTAQHEVLLREIHHRVKNNLSIVISLLGFQMDEKTDPELRRNLVDIQTRIRAMALIHEHLYRSKDLDRIPLAGYITDLTQMVVSTMSGRAYHLDTHLEPVDVSIETALPVGLILNELLTNIFKYAFPGMDKGNITISLSHSDGDAYILVVQDDGVGLPEGMELHQSGSLGLYIVRLLTEQLDGTLTIERNHGTLIKVTFRNIFRKSLATI